MFNRLRRFLKSLTEDDWAGAWRAPERKSAKTDNAAVQGTKLGHQKEIAPNVDYPAEVGKRAETEDSG